MRAGERFSVHETLRKPAGLLYVSTLATQVSTTTVCDRFFPPLMSALFLQRFFRNPFQVASIVPSSRTLIRRVSNKMDHSVPRVIAEYGPGEGCHTREIVKRMHKQSKLMLFELDAALCKHLERQFADDPRVSVHNLDCALLPDVLAEKGLPHCDYVVSGIPFSILEKAKKREVLENTHRVLVEQPHAAFIIYQVTNELRTRGHCDHFAHAESEWCMINLPPMFVTKFYKTQHGIGAKGQNGANGKNGHHESHHGSANGHTNGAH
jgi:phosphatidylethanolamine/phosphatidyl-N-methylethanolamine N-methyltransferase